MKDKELTNITAQISDKIVALVENARNKAALFLNVETTLLYWSIGDFLLTEFKAKGIIQYGTNILQYLSKQLSEKLGKGFSYSALTRMLKVAEKYDAENIATVSQQLSWSHLIELASLEDTTKRAFYATMAMQSRWNVRELRKQIDKMLFERTAIATQPDEIIKEALLSLENKADINPDLIFKNSYILDFLDLPFNYSEKELENALIDNIERFILELGNGFAFIERQKRISVDAEDYYLDLLFYHRKLRRLVAIDLKLGKFKPAHKAQMELYLRWLERYELEEGEQKPLGLLLCSEGNSEHIEFLMLDEPDIKVAQYLTDFPTKEWFMEKMHRAVEIAQSMNNHPKK